MRSLIYDDIYEVAFINKWKCSCDCEDKENSQLIGKRENTKRINEYES